MHQTWQASSAVHRERNASPSQHTRAERSHRGFAEQARSWPIFQHRGGGRHAATGPCPACAKFSLLTRDDKTAHRQGHRKPPKLHCSLSMGCGASVRLWSKAAIWIYPPSPELSRRHAPCEVVGAPGAGGAAPTCHTNHSPFSCIKPRALHKPTMHPQCSTRLPDAPRHEIHECADACGLLAAAEIADVVAPVVGRQLIQTHHQLSGRHGVAADARR